MSKRYMRAFGALYGGQAELSGLPPLSRKERVDSTPLEYQEQMVAATWLTKNDILFYHVPNGGYRKAQEASKFKAMGVKAGVPDLVIPIARKGHHGLYIELKRVSGGTLSDAQKFWMEKLREQGYDCYEAKGAQDLINYVKNYLGVPT
jgi:hypothetical protein